MEVDYTADDEIEAFDPKVLLLGPASRGCWPFVTWSPWGGETFADRLLIFYIFYMIDGIFWVFFFVDFLLRDDYKIILVFDIYELSRIDWIKFNFEDLVSKNMRIKDNWSLDYFKLY